MKEERKARKGNRERGDERVGQGDEMLFKYALPLGPEISLFISPISFYYFFWGNLFLIFLSFKGL